MATQSSEAEGSVVFLSNIPNDENDNDDNTLSTTTTYADNALSSEFDGNQYAQLPTQLTTDYHLSNPTLDLSSNLDHNASPSQSHLSIQGILEYMEHQWDDDDASVPPTQIMTSSSQVAIVSQYHQYTPRMVQFPPVATEIDERDFVLSPTFLAWMNTATTYSFRGPIAVLIDDVSYQSQEESKYNEAEAVEDSTEDENNGSDNDEEGVRIMNNWDRNINSWDNLINTTEDYLNNELRLGHLLWLTEDCDFWVF